jgi:hypothetical protein
MSNKKETPVRWLVKEIEEKFNFRFASFYGQQIQHALEMESKKQQKYDEMLAMLEMFVNENKNDTRSYGTYLKAEQLIKEAKEL